MRKRKAESPCSAEFYNETTLDLLLTLALVMSRSCKHGHVRDMWSVWNQKQKRTEQAQLTKDFLALEQGFSDSVGTINESIIYLGHSTGKDSQQRYISTSKVAHLLKEHTRYVKMLKHAKHIKGLSLVEILSNWHVYVSCMHVCVYACVCARAYACMYV